MNDALGVGALDAVSVNVAHDVVTDQPFPFLGDLVVDVVLVGLQLGDLLSGDGQAQLVLGLGQGDPEEPPGSELLIRGEKVLHFFAGVAGAEGALVGIVHCVLPFFSRSHRYFYCTINPPGIQRNRGMFSKKSQKDGIRQADAVPLLPGVSPAFPRRPA